MTQIRREGDSIGAKLEIIADGLPPGWGEPIFDRLDAEIASAMMGINAVKGVEIGDGFDVVNQRGSQHRDELTPEGFLSNHAGGVALVARPEMILRQAHLSERPLRYQFLASFCFLADLIVL